MPGADDNLEGQSTGAAGSENKEGAHGAGQEGQGNPPKEMTPEEMKAEIAKLRKENANRRTTAKNLEASLGEHGDVIKKFKEALGIQTDDEKPEVVLSQLQQSNAALQMEIGIRDLAMEHSIPKEHMKYFSFLFQEALSDLEEGEELSEDAIAAVAEQVRALGGTKAGSSGVGTGKGSTPPPASGSGQPDALKFSKMSLTEKGQLYKSNPELYNSLFAEAKSKRLI